MSTKLFEASSEEITKLQELIYQKMTPFKCPLCKTYFEITKNQNNGTTKKSRTY